MTKNIYEKYSEAFRDSIAENCLDDYNDVKSILRYCSKEVCDTPLVTFFIPTFNRLDTLKDALESIVHQDVVFEYDIIVLDNSGDLSSDNEIFKYMIDMQFKNLRYFVNEKNIGMFGNWNRGILIAKGEYVAMLHDDDLLSDNYMEYMWKILLYIKENNINVGCVKTRQKDFFEKNGLPVIECKNNEIIKCTLLECLFRGVGPTTAPSCGTIFLKKAIAAVGGFNKNFYPCSDHILGYMLVKYGYVVYETTQYLGYYRYSINESMREEVMRSFFVCDYFFREYMYSLNIFNRLFGIIFRECQYKESLNRLAWGIENFNVNLLIDELDFKNFRVRKLTEITYKILKRLFRSYRKRIYKKVLL